MVLSNSFEVEAFEGIDTAAPAVKGKRKKKERMKKTVALLKAAPWPFQIFFFPIQLMKWALKGIKGLWSESFFNFFNVYIFTVGIHADKSDLQFSFMQFDRRWGHF